MRKREKLKCQRGPCTRTTRDPEADGWTFMEEEPPFGPGWWCPQCSEDLAALLDEAGIEAIDTEARRQ